MPRFVTIGGGIDETSVSLCVYGDELVPDQVSQALGVEATHSHRKGEARKSRSPDAPRDLAWKSGAWILKIRGKAPHDPEKLTEDLLDKLPDDEGPWPDLASRYGVNLRYGLHMTAWNRGFDLSPALVARIARIQAEITFDIYAYLEQNYR